MFFLSDSSHSYSSAGGLDRYATLSIFLLLGFVAPGLAVDGVIEINQAKVIAFSPFFTWKPCAFHRRYVNTCTYGSQPHESVSLSAAAFEAL